jgi:ribosome biogenesis GTPase
VDRRKGTLRSGCRGPMEPVGIARRYKGEWALIHRCRNCGMLGMNRIAGDDHPLPLLSLAVRPSSGPPFPLDPLRELIFDEEGGRS